MKDTSSDTDSYNRNSIHLLYKCHRKKADNRPCQTVNDRHSISKNKSCQKYTQYRYRQYLRRFQKIKTCYSDQIGHSKLHPRHSKINWNQAFYITKNHCQCNKHCHICKFFISIHIFSFTVEQSIYLEIVSGRSSFSL